MIKTIIAAYASGGVIGNNGRIPWHIPEDLKRFQKLTLHHPVIMGSRTYQSILNRLGEPLPQRTSLVLTSKRGLHTPPGVIPCHSLDDAFTKAESLDKEVFIAGGGFVYTQAIFKADKLELTEIHEYYVGDTWFPVSEIAWWQEKKREKHDGFDFVTYLPDPLLKR